MTVIVGVTHNNRVWIGGDSAGVAGYSLSVRTDEKVFRRGPYVMGFTSSFRMGQLLRYALDVPAPSGAPDEFMATVFVDAVRKCLKAGGWLTETNGNEEGGSFLVGVGGLLYGIDTDFQIARFHGGYAAVGCGADIALGSLHTSVAVKPKWRVMAALEAAEAHSAGVRGPYVVMNTKAAE